ncbi:MAG: benzoate-CoA ligase family protein [Deltaproteobacteria bacterium]|nr:benzoate-CoA ligase family protein [Deltaproteobacteria bacterium]
MASYYLDDRIAEGRGHNVAVRVGAQSWTYSEVLKLSNRAGNALRSRGIGNEDRVLVLLPDGIDFVAAWFGILKVGAVFCMQNPLASADDMAHVLDYTRARAVVAHVSVLDRLVPALDRVREHVRAVFVADGQGPYGTKRWEEAIIESSDELENADTKKDDMAGFLFTSGSTGKPKAAVHLHHDFPWNTECYAKRVLAMTEKDVCVSVPKLFFGYATGTNLMFPFAVGATACLFPARSTPEAVYDAIERFRPTLLTNVPTMIAQMLDHERAKTADLSCLRAVLSAGEALPEELHRRWLDRFGVEILDGIGSAEMFHIYITNAPGDVVMGSLGKVVPGYEAKIVGADGNEVPDGEIGRLKVRGDSCAVGYFRDHESSKATFEGDWCLSADLFRRDRDARFWYVGRADDVLKVHGVFVAPAEIEACLLLHPAVRESAVIGVTDDNGLTVAKAFVVVRDGHGTADALAQELRTFVREKIGAHKSPQLVAFLGELPRNDRGKVNRRALRDGAEAPSGN